MRALVSTTSEATCTALPAVCSERDPIVPLPRGTCPVSDWTSTTWSMGIPRTLETTIEKAVSWPWPWALVPTLTVTVPSSFTSTAPYSVWSPRGAVTST